LLTQERIRKAEYNVKQYLSEGLLTRTLNANGVVEVILKDNYLESLDVATDLLKNGKSFLWTIVCSYYAMFYAASLALFREGYKIEHKIPHKVCSDALISILRNRMKLQALEEYELAKGEALSIAGLEIDDVLESFEYERIKRSRVQYGFNKGNIQIIAKTSLERAKRFIFEMEKIIMS
jgi:hypothetical protein